MIFEEGVTRGFTLLETLIVIVIISILAAIALPYYYGVKEQENDKDASTNLKLIMAAEKIYRMEVGAYDVEDSGNAATDIANINDILRLSLPSAGNRVWDYKTVADNGAAPPTACAQATRTTAGLIGASRTLRFRNTGEDDPVSGTCP